MTTFIAGTPASAYAPTPAPRAVRAPTNEERLASAVEHLERELSRRETAERRLAQELASAKAETEVRDQQIADICAQWERSVTQMQTARDEDVAHVTERLRYVEEVEVPSVRAQLEDAEMRCARANAAREAAEQRLAVAEEDTRRVAAERDRRLAAAAADFQRALEERDRRLRELERKRAADAVEAERRRTFELRDAEQKWDLERQQLRDDLEHVMAGAARFVRGEVLHKHRMANLPAEVAAATSVDEDAIRRILRRRSTKGEGGAPAPASASASASASAPVSPGTRAQGAVQGAEGGTANANANASPQHPPQHPPQPQQPPQPQRPPQPPPVVASAPSPKPEPRAAPPPVPTSAHATPATERRPVYVPGESLVPPPPPLPPA